MASSVGRLLRQLAKRVYAVALVLIILWLSWRAVFYLVSSLMLPAKPPPQIVDIPTRLSPSAVVRSDSAAIQATANPRSPLSHYHRLDQGFQPDHHNGCTISGCHAPLPHGKNRADRAFLNMHATSIHCAVCHVQNNQTPLDLAWYDLQSGGELGRPPSLLRAFAWLTSPAVRDKKEFTSAEQTEIVRLLRAAVDEAGGEPQLASLAGHLAAVRATSDEFTRLVQVTRDAVQGQFRGEYGAKLALLDAGTRKPFLGMSGIEAATKTFLARRGTLTEPEKTALLKQIHPPRRDRTLQCGECHRVEGSLVNFSSLGYPPARIQAISSPLVTEAIEHIIQGKPFYLPGVLRTEGGM